MHKFSTSSGKQLWYDVISNRIGIWTPEKDNEVSPVVHFKAPSTIDASKITMFTIEMTQQCNLRCTYCCYSGNYRDRRAHNTKEISYDTLQKTVEYIQRHYDESAEEITICFYGGEALLARKKIEWMVSELRSIFKDKVRFSFSTNGLLLTEEVIDWLNNVQNALVNVTIDGNRDMHDVHRRTVSGKGSYDIIIKNLRLFKSKYPDFYRERVRFLSTVYSWNDVLKLAEVWDDEPALEGHYPIHISHIIPDFEDHSRRYDNWDVKNNFYRQAFEAYKRGKKGILYGCFQKLIDIIDNRNYLKLPAELNIHTCYQGLFSNFINVDGDLYACEKFCGELKAGNVKCGIDEKCTFSLLQRFTERKNHLCSSCWAQRFCRMCMTSLNYTEEEIKMMCDMERDTIDLALRYYCDYKDWIKSNNKELKK